MMKTSTQGLTILIEREGSKNEAYRDSEGYWTVGVGHLLSHDKSADFSHVVWTDDQIRDALAKDIRRFEDTVNAAVKVPLEQHQFDALVSFAFNVGVTAFEDSTLLKRVNDKLFDQAAIQFDRWHIPPEITSRRNGEREQFRGSRFAARIP